MDRLTKQYSNGNITLDASQFPPIAQEVIDSEIRNSQPIKAAIKRLAEYEDRDTKGCGYCTRLHMMEVYIKFIDNSSVGSPDRLNPHRISHYCPICGRKLM